eukprot:CAMPEP_0194205740 /NCGR_PEP_ID=MMETSP0156-20130528/4958_1 /TAXON_ID=33649 /ORGANISM="Thalassionema nitzschioides, Strain L26-B" /LENGTH=274 /DNA_ID=CAMNT_0038932099 /DNA_START=83 /DNA_END=907 /DNA_ORIENTATION=-
MGISIDSRFIVVLSLVWVTVVNSLIVLPDGRRVHIIKNNPLLDNVGDFIISRVEELANAAIEEKGAFSMTIGSGTTVKPLAALAGRVDFTKVHIFFGNERTEGDAAGKCYRSGSEVFESLCIPEGNLHRVPERTAEDAAEAYEAEIRNMPSEVVGVKAGLPSFDLCLLGSGVDGHCASLYPKSSQVVVSPGNTHAYLAAEGKGGITISIDALNAARNVLLSAGKVSQSDMARKCLAWSNAATNHNLPAGMISTSLGAVVEWILTEESAADLPAM